MKRARRELLALATAPDLNLPATMLPDSLAQAVVVSVVDTAAAAAVGATTITGTLVDHLSEMAIVTGSRARITTVPNLRDTVGMGIRGGRVAAAEVWRKRSLAKQHHERLQPAASV